MSSESNPEQPFRVVLVSTGGTIEKTYDEMHGVMTNEVSVLQVMLSQMELGDVKIERVSLMNKDSLEMTEEDHQLIATTVLHRANDSDGIIIVHGTDRLATTGEAIYAQNPAPPVPILLTGAMRPYVMRTTDALQNLTGAMMAVQLAKPGVYCSMHNKLLQFPGVVKDLRSGTFVKE